jgi:Na+/H+-dicarboxylate symporter
MKLWQKIVIGFVLGLGLGLVAGPHQEYIPIAHLFTLINGGGKLFINSIKMLIVPLVFASLIVGITSMHDIKKMGRIGLKAMLVFLGTTAVAITIGLGLSNVLQLGAGLNLVTEGMAKVAESPSFLETIINVVPTNPVASLATGNILQVLTFAILLGIAINFSGEKGKPLAKLCESLAETMYTLTDIVMKAAPYGVFCLMAGVCAQYGLDVILPLIKVIGALYFACALHIVFVYGGALSLAKLNPMRFFTGMTDANLVAFTTTSSSGTLPVTMRCTEENLGVSNSIASFVLPLGATVNMNGTAIYQGITVIFIANAAGIDLTFANYVTIVLTATLASIGTAGVPGGGLIMLSLVLTSVGLPIEGVALVAGIDRILDMARTMVNVMGDALASVLVAKSENELDLVAYNLEPTV